MTDTLNQVDAVDELIATIACYYFGFDTMSPYWKRAVNTQHAEALEKSRAKLNALLVDARITVLNKVLETRGVDGCDGYCDTVFVEEYITELEKQREAQT